MDGGGAFSLPLRSLRKAGLRMITDANQAADAIELSPLGKTRQSDFARPSSTRLGSQLRPDQMTASSTATAVLHALGGRKINDEIQSTATGKYQGTKWLKGRNEAYINLLGAGFSLIPNVCGSVAKVRV